MISYETGYSLLGLDDYGAKISRITLRVELLATGQQIYMDERAANTRLVSPLEALALSTLG